MSDKVSIIIPCYWVTPEHVEMTKLCYNSIKDIDEVLLIDDSSPFKWTTDNPPYISLPENKGYPGAVDEGLRRATGDYLIISNNDIEFIDPNWLQHLLKPLKEGFGISSIRTTEPDGWETEDKITENDKFGCLWAIRRDIYDQLKMKIDGQFYLLDPVFGKGYGEDLDLWHRAREAGIKIAKNHAGLAEHKGKATFLAMNDGRDDNFQRFVPIYKRKWGDKAHLILSPDNLIVLFTDPELADMGDLAKRYLDRELSLEQVNERFGTSW